MREFDVHAIKNKLFSKKLENELLFISTLCEQC